ncbi:MAG TPA: hypothetical protein VJQ79_07245 [Acidimicrobiia bacterium]|nr:hypothetical protein [Acidimicrobiia bacterium]
MRLMGYQRSPDRDKAARAWTDFVAANAGRFQQAGLPRSARQSIGHWDDLLAHGHLTHNVDPTNFSVESLTTQCADRYPGFLIIGRVMLTLRWMASATRR